MKPTILLLGLFLVITSYQNGLREGARPYLELRFQPGRFSGADGVEVTKISIEQSRTHWALSMGGCVLMVAVLALTWRAKRAVSN